MTISMMFRGVSATGVIPDFVDPVPLIASANLSQAKQAAVVFFASAFFTAFFVTVTVLARHHDN